MTENSFKRCFLIYVRLQSSLPKSKVGKSPAQVNGLVSIFADFLCNLSDAVRHVTYIAAFNTLFQENACFCYYALTKYLPEVNLKIRRSI